MGETVLSASEQDARYGRLLPELRGKFPADYSSKLAFHSYAHVFSVEAAADDFLVQLEALGARGLPSHFALGLASLGHDAGMPQFYGLHPYPKLDPNPYSCPEELSIKITANRGRVHGVDEATLAEVGAFQWTTKAGFRARSWGGMILCVADLSSAAGDYEKEFLANGAKLRQERIVTKGEDLGEAGYRDFSVWLLSTYIAKNLRGATAFSQDPDIDPLQFFAPQIQAIEQNVTQLATERAEENGESLEAYAFARGDDVPEVLGFSEAA